MRHPEISRYLEMPRERIKPSCLPRDSGRLRSSGRYDCFARELLDYCDYRRLAQRAAFGACPDAGAPKGQTVQMPAACPAIRSRGRLLHRFSLQRTCACCLFSPSGKSWARERARRLTQSRKAFAVQCAFLNPFDNLSDWNPWFLK